MEIKLYKYLTYILLIPNTIVGLVAIFSFFTVFLGNILGIFQTLIFVSVIIYAIYSFIFLQKIILKNQILSFKVKRKIKLTAILSFMFTVLSLFSIIPLLANSDRLDTIIGNTFDNLKNINPKGFDIEKATMLVKFFMFCWSVYLALFLLHLLMSFKLVDVYKNNFTKPTYQ